MPVDHCVLSRSRISFFAVLGNVLRQKLILDMDAHVATDAAASSAGEKVEISDATTGDDVESEVIGGHSDVCEIPFYRYVISVHEAER